MKIRKSERREKKRAKRLRGRNYHHIKNRCDGGTNDPENLLLIDKERHDYWHRVFKNLDLYEAIEMLIRLGKMKHYENINPKFSKYL